jgi:phosphoglycolate phosphatase
VTSADAVLFDLDGVLVDSRRAFAASINAALAANGAETLPDEQLHPFLGPPLHETFETLLGGPGPAVDACVDAYRSRYREMAAAESAVFDGIPEALEELGARVPLVVATSKAQALAVPLLEALGVAHHFTGIAGPPLAARHETKGETMGRALAMLPAGCARPVMVGDRKYDVLGAREHGMPCIGVLWGAGTAHELREAGADVLADAPADLPALLS